MSKKPKKHKFTNPEIAPKGAWYQKQNDGLIIGVPKYNLTGGLVFFLFSGFFIYPIYYILIDPEMIAALALFFVPPVLMFLYKFLSSIWGEITFTIKGDYLHVFEGIFGKIGFSRTFKLKDIEKVYCKEEFGMLNVAEDGSGSRVKEKTLVITTKDEYRTFGKDAKADYLDYLAFTLGSFVKEHRNALAATDQPNQPKNVILSI